MKKLTHPVTQTLRGMFNGRGHTEEKRAPTLFHDEHAAGRQRGKDFATCCPRFGRRFWSGPEVHNQELEPVVGHQPVNTAVPDEPIALRSYRIARSRPRQAALASVQSDSFEARAREGVNRGGRRRLLERERALIQLHVFLCGVTPREVLSHAALHQSLPLFSVAVYL